MGSGGYGYLRGRPSDHDEDRQADGGDGEHRMVCAVPDDEEDGDSAGPQARLVSEGGLCHGQPGSGPGIGAEADRSGPGAATDHVCKTPDGWTRQVLVGGQTVEAVEQFIKGGVASTDTDAAAEKAKSAAADDKDKSAKAAKS